MSVEQSSIGGNGAIVNFYHFLPGKGRRDQSRKTLQSVANTEKTNDLYAHTRARDG